MFDNRTHAGKLLANRIMDVYKHVPALKMASPIIVALPRGGVPVALAVAKGTQTPLDILVSKKIPAPNSPEFAIGAVTSGGLALVDGETVRSLNVPSDYVHSEVIALKEKTVAQEEYFRQQSGCGERKSLHNRAAILIDDGVATGLTAIAAVRTLKALGARWIIVAAPVIAADTAQSLNDECDLVVAVQTPQLLQCVAEFYHDFHQADDDEVIDALREGLSINDGNGRNLAAAAGS